MRDSDSEEKPKRNHYADMCCGIKPSNIRISDQMLLRQEKVNIYYINFEHKQYQLIDHHDKLVMIEPPVICLVIYAITVLTFGDKLKAFDNLSLVNNIFM